MLKDCKVQTYTKVKIPDSPYQAKDIPQHMRPKIWELPIIRGDLNIMYKEDDEEIDKELDEWNRNQHQREDDQQARWRRQNQ